MPIPQLTPKCRLHGISIFLSASIPTPERRDEYKRIHEPRENFERIPEAPLRIEEAIVCIARAIFMEGGTLVFGGHPSISPLVARVVDHYYLPAPAEELRRGSDRESHDVSWKNPSLVIYQSRVWEKHWVEATKRLTLHRLVRVEWREAEPGESVDPKIKNRPQAPKSMKKMRKDMIEQTSPVAMIAIGGMVGVLDEAQLFAELRPGSPSSRWSQPAALRRCFRSNSHTETVFEWLMLKLKILFASFGSIKLSEEDGSDLAKRPVESSTFRMRSLPSKSSPTLRRIPEGHQTEANDEADSP